MHIQSLKLTNFRNIESCHLKIEDASIVALYGENGAGKTSVLEALALLSPGRGLHRNKMDSHVKQSEDHWAIHTILSTETDEQEVGQMYQNKKRHVKLNGEPLKSQTELSSLGNVLWLTPKMDRLFMDDSATRREFFDRLVFGIHSNHAELLARYKHHIKSRMKLLKDHADPDWITLEEQQAADLAEKIHANRQNYLSLFAEHAENIQLKISHTGENYLETWKSQRVSDLRTGITHTGPHRMQVGGLLLPENIKISQTSTGQHKRAVLNILLANARLIAYLSGNPPLLLMDEITAHIDEKTRAHFFNEFVKLGSQVWLTGTEKKLFNNLDCLCISVEHGSFRQ